VVGDADPAQTGPVERRAATDGGERASVAVIVGGGGALGSASAVALAKRDFRCLLTGPTPESLERAAKAVTDAGGEALAVPADASVETDVVRVFDECRKRWGPCDVLVHAAAIQGPTSPLLDVSYADWESVMRVNLGSVFLCTREALGHMVTRRRGAIVLVSSADALRGFPMTGPYAATKSALAGFARAISAEAGADGVRINVLTPGPMPEAAIYQTAVSGIARQLGLEADEVLEHVTGASRAYAASDIARGTVFLATSDSEPMTGQVLVMDSLLTHS
jgi:NAD(P)-dependent dehydrogenase (short-subunit alcohol dehydrogenase family)